MTTYDTGLTGILFFFCFNFFLLVTCYSHLSEIEIDDFFSFSGPAQSNRKPFPLFYPCGPPRTERQAKLESQYSWIGQKWLLAGLQLLVKLQCQVELVCFRRKWFPQIMSEWFSHFHKIELHFIKTARSCRVRQELVRVTCGLLLIFPPSLKALWVFEAK